MSTPEIPTIPPVVPPSKLIPVWAVGINGARWFFKSKRRAIIKAEQLLRGRKRGVAIYPHLATKGERINP